jgi:outer membrane cobalamin receptor
LYSYWNRGVPGVELGYSPSAARQIDRDLITSVKYNRTINKRTGLVLNFNYKYSLMSYYDPATFTLSAPINSFYKINTLSSTGLFELNYAEKSELHFGFEAEKSNISSNETIDGNLIHGSISTSLKNEFNRKHLPFITIYPSLRYDYYSNISGKSVVTSKLGINILPVKNVDLAIKSSVGNNFLAPTFNELYWKDLGNPDLKPERSVNFDCGLFYKFFLLINSEFEGSYFIIKSSDRIVWQPGSSNLWRPVNIGSVLSEGINVSYKGSFDIKKRLKAVISGNYNFAKSTKQSEDFPGDPSFGKQLIYIPQEFFKASIGLSYLTTSKYIKFVSLKSFYNYSGKRFSNSENTFYSPHYGIFDMNLSAELNIFSTDIDMKFAVNNVMNKSYQVVTGYPMPLRNFKIEIGFKY